MGKGPVATGDFGVREAADQTDAKPELMGVVSLFDRLKVGRAVTFAVLRSSAYPGTG